MVLQAMSSCRAARADYLLLTSNSDFQRAVQAKLSTLRQRARVHGPCLLTGKPGNKRYGAGYASFKASHPLLSRKKVEFYVHHLLWMQQQGWARIVPEAYEVSHLCHQTKCLQPEHVCVETAREHDDRDACKGKEIVIACFGNHQATRNPCTHEPPCILPIVHLEILE